jgi:hypothetical protein
MLPTDAREVFHILQMWEIIEQSASALSALEIEQLGAEDKEVMQSARFAGFDVMTELKQLTIAEFMVEELQLFDGFKDRKLASRKQSIGEYRLMLEVFNPFLDLKRSQGDSETLLLNSTQLLALVKFGKSYVSDIEKAFQKSEWAKRHSAELMDGAVPKEVKAFIREWLQIEVETQ